VMIKRETGLDQGSSTADRQVLKNRDTFKRIMLSLVDQNFSSYLGSTKAIFGSMTEFLGRIQAETKEFQNGKRKLFDTTLGFNTLNCLSVFSYGTKMLRDSLPAGNSDENIPAPRKNTGPPLKSFLKSMTSSNVGM
jgi:hypothetical protein